jgi:ABC-type uncharacterized transport system substrate-binding protein
MIPLSAGSFMKHPAGGAHFDGSKLIVNLKTASALGIQVPESILVRANETGR